MISKLSERAAEALFASDDISESDREMYSYGFFMMFSHLFFLALTVFYGFLFGIILESVIFYIVFTVIRENAGGVHASTEKICAISTSLALLVCVAVIRTLENLALIIIPTLMIIISTPIIFAFSPVDSTEKPLSQTEKMYYKKKTILYTVVVIIVSLISVCCGFKNVHSCCGTAFLFECVLILLGKTKNVCACYDNFFN